jgi:hypothetical protein
VQTDNASKQRKMISGKAVWVAIGIAAVLVVVVTILLLWPAPEEKFEELSQACESPDFSCRSISVSQGSILLDLQANSELEIRTVASVKCRGVAQFRRTGEYTDLTAEKLLPGDEFSLMLENCNNGALGDPFDTVLSITTEQGTSSISIVGQVKS